MAPPAASTSSSSFAHHHQNINSNNNNMNNNNGGLSHHQKEHEEVTTIFVVGFPDDITDREFQNMFMFAPGFEGATLKIPQSMLLNDHDGHQQQQIENGNKKQIIGFAKFKNKAEALHAKDLLNGRRIDPEKYTVLKAEIAKKNLHKKRGGSFINDNFIAAAIPDMKSSTGISSASTLLSESSIVQMSTSPSQELALDVDHLVMDLSDMINYTMTTTATSAAGSSSVSSSSSIASSISLSATAATNIMNHGGFMTSASITAATTHINTSSSTSSASSATAASHELSKLGQIVSSGMLSRPSTPSGLLNLQPLLPALNMNDSDMLKKDDTLYIHSPPPIPRDLMSATDIDPMESFAEKVGLSRTSSTHSLHEFLSKFNPRPPEFMEKLQLTRTASGSFGHSLFDPSLPYATDFKPFNLHNTSSSHHHPSNTAMMMVPPSNNVSHNNSNGTSNTTTIMNNINTINGHNNGNNNNNNDMASSNMSSSVSATTATINNSGFSSSFDNMAPNPSSHFEMSFSAAALSAMMKENGGVVIQDALNNNNTNKNNNNSGNNTLKASSNDNSIINNFILENIPSSHPAHRGTADQNPPCNTLYVGNLPPDTYPEELEALFSTCKGYKRLCFRNRLSGPMCFVEFEDIPCAAQAMQELYGVPLSTHTKGGIRLSFSKNPLGVRPNSTTNSNPILNNGNNTNGNSTSNNINNNNTNNNNTMSSFKGMVRSNSTGPFLSDYPVESVYETPRSSPTPIELSSTTSNSGHHHHQYHHMHSQHPQQHFQNVLAYGSNRPMSTSSSPLSMIPGLSNANQGMIPMN